MRRIVWREEESLVGTAPIDIKTQADGFVRHLGKLFFRWRKKRKHRGKDIGKKEVFRRNF